MPTPRPAGPLRPGPLARPAPFRRLALLPAPLARAVLPAFLALAVTPAFLTLAVTPAFLTLLLPLPAAAQDPDAPLMRADAFEVVTLAEGVHAFLRRDPPDDAANGNVLVIVNETDVVVVDANLTPASAEAVIDRIRGLTPNPVRYVINTHWHDDHVLGNAVYRDAFPGVDFIAHPYTRERILDTVATSLETNRTAYPEALRDMEDRLRRGVRRDGSTALTEDDRRVLGRTVELYRTFVGQMDRIEVVPPTLLVADSLVLRRGEREIRVQWLGRGNTAGDLVVFLPRERVLATGDLVVRPVPFSFGSYLGDWIGTLGRLTSFDAEVLVPGHGEPMRDHAYIESVRELLGAMRTQMADAVARGLSLEDARAALDLAAWQDRFAGDDPIRIRQFQQFFIAPASERAWQEAKGELR